MSLVSSLLVCAIASVEAFGRKKKPSTPTPEPETEGLLVPAVVAALAAIGMVTLALALWRKKGATVANEGPATQCSLMFEDKGWFDKSCMYALWHLSTEAPSCALATFTAGVKVAERKLVHPDNREELVKAIKSSKDVHDGWCQFVRMANKHGRASVNMIADVPNRPVLLAAVTEESTAVKCLAGSSLGLINMQAVAVAPASSKDFDMKYVDLAHFLVTGNLVGKTIDLQLGAAKASSPVNRRPSRTDFGLPTTPTTEEALRAEKSPAKKATKK